jgi:hypothetical protein
MNNPQHHRLIWALKEKLPHFLIDYRSKSYATSSVDTGKAFAFRFSCNSVILNQKSKKTSGYLLPTKMIEHFQFGYLVSTIWVFVAREKYKFTGSCILSLKRIGVVRMDKRDECVMDIGYFQLRV